MPAEIFKRTGVHNLLPSPDLESIHKGSLSPFRRLQSTMSIPGDQIDGSIKESSCDVCSKLMAAMASPQYGEYIELGIWYELLESNCAKHKPILEFAMGEWKKFKENDHALISVSTSHGGTLNLHASRAWLLFKLATSKELPSPGPGRLLKEWIECDLLRQWKHGCTCEFESLIPELSHIRPRLLIDTHDMCLKWTAQDDQYLALSYCWGQTPSFKTTNAIYDQLRKSGSLNDSRIPATIKHAMCLTAELGERYLWVDALCIVQDNDTFRDQEINNMAAIYSNAKLTIIAAGGADSAHGLIGVEGGFPRKPPQSYELLDSSLVVHYNPTPLPLTTWGSRGWTYQEKLFSSRKIIFKDDTVEWQCGCARWEESECDDPWTIDATSEIKNLEWYQKDKTLFNSVWPDYEEYQELVSYYSPSKVTLPEDIYNTFRGITFTLSKSFYGGFNFGLPMSFFDVALLWDFSMWDSGGFDSVRERRISFDPNKKLPSWSWMGWYGIIDATPIQARVGPQMQRNYGNYPYKHAGLNRLIPIVKWYTISAAGKHQAVESTWDNYRQASLSDSLEVPPGWTRHQNHPKEKTHYFTTRYAPGVEFMYPFPLIHDLPPSDRSPILSTYIGCHAQRIFLTISPTRDQKYPTKLFDESGKIVGYIRCTKAPISKHTSHVEPSSDHGLESTEPSYPSQRVELVAISQGTCKMGDYPLYTHQADRGVSEDVLGSALHYYNVLSIWWEDGVAYRDGLGIVFKDDWESAELESFDLVLG